jgi:hypothetical protein
MRSWADARTAYNRLAYPERIAADNAHFAQAVLRRAERAGIDLGDSDLARTASQIQMEDGVSDSPVPGGVGYGVTFLDSEMHWSSKTCIYHHLVAPKTPGGDVTTWLYNTSTNRSEKGVEAYISYYAEDDFLFRVFDWSYADTDTSPWQKDMTYDDLSEYLSSVESADGAYRQELHLVNCTLGAGTNWTNEVWLRNVVRDGFDQVYQRSYTLASADENLYSPGDSGGWWGPIFETFQDHDGTNKAIGTGNVWVYQDNTTWHRLDSTNSTLRIDDEDLNPPLFLVDHTKWAVGSTVGEFATSMVEAEDLDHSVGSASPGGWTAEPADGQGWMVWGSSAFGATPGAGDYVVQFDLSVAALGTEVTAFIAVQDNNTSKYVAKAWVGLQEFVAANNIQPFRLEFSTTGSEDLTVGIHYRGNGTLTADRISIVEN